MEYVAMTREQFWKLIEKSNWQEEANKRTAERKTPKNAQKKVRKALRKQLPSREHRQAFMVHFRDVQKELAAAVEEWITAGLSEDGYSPRFFPRNERKRIYSHIIALGEIEYLETLNSPVRARRRWEQADFNQDVPDAIPTEEEYASGVERKGNQIGQLNREIEQLKKEVVDAEKALFGLRRSLSRKINELEKLQPE